MIKATRTFSSYAVADLEAARQFYATTLGLDVRDSREPGLLELHFGGESSVLLYLKPDFVPATYTVLNFEVADVQAAVDELIASGVTMERYPGMEQDEKGIASGMGPTIAWFTDPSGNILSVLGAN
jgi:predicted enzyme related to lactoylglutathione lyase